ncbi:MULTISPECIES: NAD-dependent epimerase/dehydratase family protein [Micromonospora]|uniref:NAD-dependent epimerase/dehydratase family protein n=1 Tax=Micromonospora sicca TaxID=2202420 RepID=A0ABU5JNF6_9ACTN|nr:MULTISPECIES: NAD-dependent epimerase/dehydratase family protein [unclassified Micromonospora]MBM0225052.1 NAD-dependent epimerase/dehydratase family protein [Micromonospora sp. ATA51]MDZ5447102.1 NAD-dependent epimerase/dehydratase family protein [Micromonospora sp. 4G57]MDZ5494157.1 NAD-dependent epimerase/dehydratase family protein [Micromonospora sp. 4G53]
MNIVLTGAGGFLGWHVRVLLRAIGWPEPVVLTQADLTRPADAADRVGGADLLLHLGGVNRGSPAELAAGNLGSAAALVQVLRRCPVPPKRVVFANSVQAGNGTPYGDTKAAAAAALAAAADVGYDFDDVLLPNLYGEHGRPFYNSVVATFCRVLADGGRPEVAGDRQLDLVHVQDAAARLIGAPPGHAWDPSMPPVRIDVALLAAWLTDFATTYRSGEIPALSDRHAVRLFNTYRSHCFPSHFPLPLTRRSDVRGTLVETMKVHGGGGQTFASTTRPGNSRGDHFHLAKVERFAVLRGTAEIRLRRVGHREVVRFPVSGDDPVVVDMPTMWAHEITNTGTEELLTLFWANELFDPARPDTYPEPVAQPSLPAAETPA